MEAKWICKKTNNQDMEGGSCTGSFHLENKQILGD